MLNIDKSRGIEFEDNSLRDGGFCKILDFEEGNTSKNLPKNSRNQYKETGDMYADLSFMPCNKPKES